MLFSIVMVRARFLLTLLLAVILGLGAAEANAERRGKRAPAVAATPDEAFVQARQAAMRGDLAQFEAAAARAGDHPLRVYLDYWRLRTRVGAARNGSGGSDGEADAQVQAFIARQPGTLVADLLRRDWILDLGRRERWAELEAQYAQWILRDDSRASCYAWLAGVKTGKPLPAEAREALFQPRELGQACDTLLEQLARDGKVSGDDLWRRLKIALEVGATTTVRSVADLMGLPGAGVEAALKRPAKVIGTAAPMEILVIALVQLARQDPEEALERFGELGGLPRAERDFMMSQIAAQSMRKLSPQANELTRQALGASASDETWAWLARAAIRASDWATLHTVYESMGPEARSDPAWIYWHARADSALGRPEQARAQFSSISGEFSFYGLLAAEELGKPLVLPKPPPPPSAAELAEPARNEGFARALKFYELGLRFDGNREWNFQLRGMSDRQLNAAAEWACRRSVLDRCVNTAERTVAEHDFALRFIMPYRDQLSPVAEERGLDPAWVYGLIRQESRFLMGARSSAGAQGLMQIIPPTARWIARKLGEPDFRIEHLNDMSTNLRFGTFYLKTVLEDLDGSPLLASAGYNAGPGRPRRWRTTLPGAVEGAVFAEIIPFSETRDYVKKVLSNATIYSTLMTGRPHSLKSLLGTVAPAGD